MVESLSSYFRMIALVLGWGMSILLGNVMQLEAQVNPHTAQYLDSLFATPHLLSLSEGWKNDDGSPRLIPFQLRDAGPVRVDNYFDIPDSFPNRLYLYIETRRSGPRSGRGGSPILGLHARSRDAPHQSTDKGRTAPVHAKKIHENGDRQTYGHRDY